MENYRVLSLLGEGTFGVVMKAKHVISGHYVALKKIRLKKTDGDPSEGFIRELKAMQQLCHPNVLQLVEAFPQGTGIVLVLEYMVSDLSDILRKNPHPLRESQVKAYLRMLLRGVDHLHKNKIMHRDLKPANLLISSSGVLKIGDFGLARGFRTCEGPYSHQVASRWYRPPELLFGARQYDQGVDLWAVGCIFGEMLVNGPIFPGENDIDQLFRVLHAFGSPREDTWPGVSKLPDFNKIVFPPMEPMLMRDIVPTHSSSALTLVSKMLILDSKKRISAGEALLHDYLWSDPLPCEVDELPKYSKGDSSQFAPIDSPFSTDSPLIFPRSPPES